MNFSPELLFKDFCIMSVLIVLAKILRLKISFFQNHFVPVALIAGVLGVLGGKQGLNVIPFSSGISQYSGLLVMFLSASLFIGNRDDFSLKKTLEQAGDSFLLNCASEAGQFGLSILVGLLMSCTVFPYIFSSFGILMPAGFVGDHGTAAVIGTTLENGGMADSISIAQTFATIGLITGIFGGVFCINIAVKRGYTNYICDMSKLPKDLRTGILPEEEQSSIGRNFFSANAIDTLTWHVALVLAAIALAYGISWAWSQAVPDFPIPVYGIALITGLIINMMLKRLRLIDYVDKRTVTRIGGTATDYLIAFGVASINLKVVVSLWKPILILSLFGIIYTFMFLFCISRRCAGKNWFEKGIFIFGWTAGAMPVAIMLLHITDPDYKSHVLEECSFAWVFLTLADMCIIAVVPTMLLKGYVFSTGIVLTAIAFTFIVLSYWFYGKQKRKAGKL